MHREAGHLASSNPITGFATPRSSTGQSWADSHNDKCWHGLPGDTLFSVAKMPHVPIPRGDFGIRRRCCLIIELGDVVRHFLLKVLMGRSARTFGCMHELSSDCGLSEETLHATVNGAVLGVSWRKGKWSCRVPRVLSDHASVWLGVWVGA